MKKALLFLLSCFILLAGCSGTETPSQTEAEGEPEAQVVAEEGEPQGESPDQEAAAPESTDDLTDWAYILDKGELVVGLDDTFAPMGFRDEAGTLVGFDIDLATAVGEYLGIKVTFQPIEWSAKDMELSTKRIDCIWNGMSITPERVESMSLTRGYLNNRIVIMTAPGVEINSKEDLVGKTVGTQAESAALEVMAADDIYSQLDVYEYPTYDEVIMDMDAGRIEVMIVDEVLGMYKNSKRDNAFVVSGVDFGDDFYAIGCRKGDDELTGKLEEAIDALIESGQAGEISDKWFGEDLVLRG